MSETADHRSWNSQAGNSDLLMLLDEVTQHCFEAGKVLRRVNVIKHPRQAAVGSAIQSQMGFGRPDIARQNDHSSFLSARGCFTSRSPWSSYATQSEALTQKVQRQTPMFIL